MTDDDDKPEEMSEDERIRGIIERAEAIGPNVVTKELAELRNSEPGVWNFAGFMQRPPPLSQEVIAKETYRRIMRGTFPTPMRARKKVKAVAVEGEELRGRFTLGHHEIDVTEYGFDLGDSQEAPSDVERAIRMLQDPLVVMVKNAYYHNRIRIREESFHTSADLTYDELCNTVSVAEIGYFEAEGKGLLLYGYVIPLEGKTRRAVYQISDESEVLKAGVVYIEDDGPKIHKIM